MNFGKETETIEFKKSTGELKEAMKSISSILNKHGIGTLYFGIKPNGDVTGQEISESTLRDVSRTIYESISPRIYPTIKEEKIDDANVIKVEFNGNEMPYSAYGRYYIRTADEDREASTSELRKFFLANEYKEKWEGSLSKCLVKQVDKKAIKMFCEEAIQAGRLASGRYTTPIILNRFGLASGEYLTNAGEALFGNNHPITVKAAIFATNEKLTFLDIQLFEDNIFNLLNICETYITKNIRWKGDIVGFKRVETPEIPLEVIRELLANSFTHAIYTANSYHEICIHPDKITIYNPGTYASRYLPEEYIKGNCQSSIRNATITKMLYLNKTIDQFGSGFKRIDKLCKESKIKYSYINNEEGFTFILYRKDAYQNRHEVKENDIKYDLSLNLTDQEVYHLLLRNNRIKREEMAKELSKSTRTIQRALNNLKEKGIITRIGSDKNGYWKVNE